MSQTKTIDKAENKVKRPKKYSVIFHNDDYTPASFVVEILQKVFHKTKEEAEFIAFETHKKGIGVAGSYTHEIAETKVSEVTNIVKLTDYPLLVTMEKE
jgi:ATP-dependent Clp protease adaptor protein ClpS